MNKVLSFFRKPSPAAPGELVVKTIPPPDVRELTPVETRLADRAAMLMSLACYALERPEWAPYLRGLAQEFFAGGLEFDEYRRRIAFERAQRPQLPATT